MKKTTTLLTLLALFCNAIPCMAHEDLDDPVVYYTDEDDELFNRGRFVGVETDEMIRARNKVRNKNWSIALGSTAVGVATLVLVGINHNK